MNERQERLRARATDEERQADVCFELAEIYMAMGQMHKAQAADYERIADLELGASLPGLAPVREVARRTDRTA